MSMPLLAGKSRYLRSGIFIKESRQNNPIVTAERADGNHVNSVFEALLPGFTGAVGTKAVPNPSRIMKCARD